MRRIAIAISLAFTLVAAAPASASMAPQDLAAVLPIARDAWPASKCRKVETVHLNADAQIAALVAEHGGAMEHNGTHVIGYADKETCEVWISQTVATRMGLCDLLAHEFGHLALSGSGGDHTKTGVMAATDAHYEPCGVRYGRAWAEAQFKRGTRCVLASVKAGTRTYHCGSGHSAAVSASGTISVNTGG